MWCYSGWWGWGSQVTMTVLLPLSFLWLVGGVIPRMGFGGGLGWGRCRMGWWAWGRQGCETMTTITASSSFPLSSRPWGLECVLCTPLGEWWRWGGGLTGRALPPLLLLLSPPLPLLSPLVLLLCLCPCRCVELITWLCVAVAWGNSRWLGVRAGDGGAVMWRCE